MFLRGTQGTMPNLQLVTAFAVRITLVRPRHYIGVPNRAISAGLGRITFGGCQKNPSWMTTNPRAPEAGEPNCTYTRCDQGEADMSRIGCVGRGSTGRCFG